MEENLLPKESEIGLKFYTTQEKGCPQDNFTVDDLLQGIKHNKYKWTYDNVIYTEEQILEGIKDGSIKLKDCWNNYDKDLFRKIRPCCKEERSPLEKKRPSPKEMY